MNESHYLTRAKGFWDPSYCPGDLFIGAPASHWLFYVVIGWFTLFLSLQATAWIGRVVIAALMSLAWIRLSRQLGIRSGMMLFSGILFLLANEQFHLAGEWVVGGVEAKCFAYVFVLLALSDIVSKQWGRVWLWLGVASAFHVLVGGWAAIAAAFCRVFVQLERLSSPESREPRFFRLDRHEGILLCTGLAIATVGIVPPLLANFSFETGQSGVASAIYVKHRISHHLDFTQFETSRIAKFALMVSLWLMLSRLLSFASNMRCLNWFCLATLLISLAGLVLSGNAESNDGTHSMLSVSLLRLYWFRLSDFAVSATIAWMLCWVAGTLVWQNKQNSFRFSFVFFVTLLTVAFGLSIWEKFEDPRPIADRRSLPSYENDRERTIATFDNWKRVCQWVRENTPEDSVFITPVEQQTFKWYAARTEVVSWKDIPQRDVNIIEWWRRVEDLLHPQQRFEQGLFAYDDQQLQQKAQQYRADYLIVLQRDLDRISTRWKLIYPLEPNQKTTYAVLQVPAGD